MALFHANFYSDVLGMQSSAEVILPDRPDPARKLPVLYLLHGLSDDHTIWQRRTSIERYAAAYYLAIVMPNGHRSFYTDMKHGRPYFTYMTQELPRLMESFFPFSTRREDRFVAGLSMGGYGAFKTAINLPERYAAGASLSGVLDIAGAWARNADFFPDVFGEDVVDPPDNVLAAAERLVAGAPKAQWPKLFQFCGTEDFLYEDNTKFRAFSKKLGLPVDYSEGPGGHSWDIWDAQIQKVLAWLPLSNDVNRTTAIG
ncbi:MAG: alpha/beta hydrolase family protein [Kiritimatiellae bacterium]|jgi:S-formylglutathione hydrolase FrmB|nr:alpha/beta hydrolase family protein [Kiritimatiellia bacterium]NLE40722.1 esterase family protein [Lentisphaerota bacterium]